MKLDVFFAKVSRNVINIKWPLTKFETDGRKACTLSLKDKPFNSRLGAFTARILFICESLNSCFRSPSWSGHKKKFSMGVAPSPLSSVNALSRALSPTKEPVYASGVCSSPLVIL